MEHGPRGAGARVRPDDRYELRGVLLLLPDRPVPALPRLLLPDRPTLDSVPRTPSGGTQIVR